MSDVDDYTRPPIRKPQEIEPHDPHGKPFSAKTHNGRHIVTVPSLSAGPYKETTGRAQVTMPAPMMEKEQTIVGVDVSNGVESHVEGYWRDGVLHVTDAYEIVNHETQEKPHD